jgi:hypothetical protein
MIQRAWTYRFEICGSIDPIVPSTPTCGEVGSNYPCVIPGSPQTYTYCNPEYNAYPFVGSFLQFFDPNPPLDCNRGSCPNTGYLSPVFQNQQGYCCTGECEVIDVSSPIFVQLINPSEVNSGVKWMSRGFTSPDNGVEFLCPVDPNTGITREKMVEYEIHCNPNGKISDPLVPIAAYDNGSCKYTLILRHFAACSTSIVPTSSPSSSPSSSPTSSPTPTSTPTSTSSPSPSPSSIINTNANSNSNSFSTSVPLITSMSLASFFGSIVLAGILLYTCNRLRTYEDDSKERLLPVKNLDTNQATARLNPISSTTNIAVSRGEEDEGTIESKRLQYGYGGGVVVQPYQESAFDEQLTYIRNLPPKFFAYLVRIGAIATDGNVLRQVQIKDDQLLKLRALGVTNQTLVTLESKYKVIEITEA